LLEENWISEKFLTWSCVAATLDYKCEQHIAARDNGGKEVTLRYRFMNISNWPLGTRVDLCA